MEAVRAAVLVLCCLGAAYYVLSTWAVVRWRARKRCAQGRVQPKVSVLKPVAGLDSGARESFVSFVRQDYRGFEVAFGILEEDDAAAGAVRDIAGRCDSASVYVGSEIEGSNNKVRILHNLARRAVGEIIVITDADTRAAPDFLSRVTAPFEDPAVGAVTCLYKGIEGRTVADALEGLHMTCVFAPGVACADRLSGTDFGLGAAIAIRKGVLDEIGGFEGIVDYLADDFQLGRRVALAGHRVVLSDYVMDIVLSGESLRSVLARELRWTRTTKASRPIGHFGLVVTFGFAYAVLFWLVSGFSAVGWAVLGSVAGLRSICAYAGARSLGDREFIRRIHLLPVRDMLSFAIWVNGYTSRTVKWRGRRLVVMKDGRMKDAK